MLLATVPLPMPPVNATVPAMVNAENVEFAVAVAFTVIVVLMVAAGATAHASRAEARIADSRVMGVLKSPPLWKRSKSGKTSSKK
jgi:hypothetical protein